MGIKYLYKVTYKCQRCGRNQKSPKINARQVKQFIPPRCEVCHRVLCQRCLKYNLCVEDYDKLPKEVRDHVKVLQRKEVKSKLIGRLIFVGGILEFILSLIFGVWLAPPQETPATFVEMMNAQNELTYGIGMVVLGPVLMAIGVIVTFFVGGGLNKANVSRYISDALRDRRLHGEPEKPPAIVLDEIVPQTTSESFWAEGPKETPPPPEEVDDGTTRECPACTNENPSNAKVCKACGYQLRI